MSMAARRTRRGPRRLAAAALVLAACAAGDPAPRPSEPALARVSLEPQDVFVTTALAPVLEGASHATGYRYAWFVDGVTAQSGPAFRFAAGDYAEGALLWVQVTPLNGAAEGRPVESNRIAVRYRRPSFVVIVTDDEEAALMRDVPRLASDVTGGGLSFTNAFVSQALCCPSRVSLLTGLYPHNHLVVHTNYPLGGERKFYETGGDHDTLGTRLQARGYRTGMIGKWLNEYGKRDPLYVAPGWTEWYGHHTNAKYFDYAVNENGTLVTYGSAEADYRTDVDREHAVAFIRRAAAAKQPFFLYVTPPAPHEPSTPPPRYARAFSAAVAPRPPSFDEPDMSDKPAAMRGTPLSAAELASIDAAYRDRLRSMLAVADLVEAVADALEATGHAGDTYVIYTSDNGYHMGQHRLRADGHPWGKNMVYEEDVRVPLVVRGPGVPAGVERRELVLNNDVAPTVLALARVAGPEADGRSLVPLLAGGDAAAGPWRTNFLLERWIDADPDPAGVDPQPDRAGVRDACRKYVVWRSGARELYDLARDPYELDNLYATAGGALKGALEKRYAELMACGPGAQACREVEDAPLDAGPPACEGAAP